MLALTLLIAAGLEVQVLSTVPSLAAFSARWSMMAFTGFLCFLLLGYPRLVSATDRGQDSQNLVLRHRFCHRTASVRVAVLMACSFGAVCVGGVAVLYQHLPAERLSPVSHDSPALLREEPIQIEANIPLIDLQTGDDFGRIVAKMDPSNRKEGRKLSASDCLHLLTAFGLDAKYEDSRFSSGEDLLRVLTDSGQATEYFGHPVMLPTRHGVRPTSGRHFGLASQAHRDQLFCCLAQLGVASEFPMVVQGKPREFGDVFRDSIANFHLGQEELEFTAIAYALYLPPNRAWANKWDREYTFAHLVEELLQRELDKSCCCGAHLVEAMIVIDRVDSEFEPVLTGTSRNRLRKRLDLIVKTVLQKQADDGSWGPQWNYDLLSKDTRSPTPSDKETAGRLLATGHITQCLAHLSPKRYPLDGSAFRRAVAWLNQTTAEVDQDFVLTNFCPCCHAAWCLDRFGRAASPAMLASHDSRSSTVAK